MGRAVHFQAHRASSTRRVAAPRRRWSRTSPPTTRCAAVAACSPSTWTPRDSSARRSASTSTARGARPSISSSRRSSTRPPSTTRRPRPAAPSCRSCRRASPGSTSWSRTRRSRSTRAGRAATTIRRTGCAAASTASARARAYDFVLMDSPPSFGPLTLSVLRAADELVVPVPLTYLALDGCAELLRTLRMVRTPLRPPGAARVDGGADLLPPHAPRPRDPRAR